MMWRSVVLLSPLALLTAIVAGCGASDASDVGTVSEAFTKCPVGTIANCDTCDREDGCIKRVMSCTCDPDPDYVPPPTCVPNPVCVSWPKTTPGFDDLALDSYGTMDTTFGGQLAAAGCHSEQYYRPWDTDNAGQWAVAICPSSFTETPADLKAGTSGVISCDPCTGRPGSGQVVIAWMVEAPPRCKTCPFPEHGCGDLACVVGEQKTPPP